MHQVALFALLYCLKLLDEGSLQKCQKSNKFLQQKGSPGTEDFDPAVFASWRNIFLI